MGDAMDRWAVALGTGLTLSVGFATYATLSSAGYFLRICTKKSRNLGVVITGSTRGFGRAMAKEFLRYGDRVVISGRDQKSVKTVIAQLMSEHEEDISNRIFGHACDVTDCHSVTSLADAATEHLGHVDVWINNAGVSQSVKASVDNTQPEVIRDIISTNLLGTLYGCQAAAKLMKSSEKGGHIFNVDGAGSRGGPTPHSLAYGASKAAIPQLTLSLAREARIAKSKVRAHVVSPGMVTTDLLVRPNCPPKTLKIFNILAEKPQTSAAWVVPRIRGATETKGYRSEYIRYLTPPGVVWRFLTAPWRKDRLFKISAGSHCSSIKP
ncbi:hypothetical protein AAMO2058_000507900 [Amorphochlora amoebiformis]